MKIAFFRKPIMVLSIIIVIAICISIGLQVYTRINNDIKVVTDSGSSFFIFETKLNGYYYVNSKLGTKCRATAFDVPEESYTTNVLKGLKELEEKDHMFSSEKNGSPIFVFKNSIYYKKCRNYNDNNQIIEGALNNIYRYDLKTKEVSVFIERDGKTSVGNPKTEVLQYFYPDLKATISKKCKNVFSYDESYYNNGRILFEICRSTSAKGATSYLYEYFPQSNQTKKIAKFNADIIDIVFVN